MRKLFSGILTFALTLPCIAENYLLNGGQASQIEYTMEQTIVPAYGTSRLIVSYVIPRDFSSPSYNQEIKQFDVYFSNRPTKRESYTDPRGNEIIKVSWSRPQRAIKGTIQLIATNRTDLQPLETEAPFPVRRIPREEKIFLRSTRQVPSEDPRIQHMARMLTERATTQFDAVQKILTWIVDHIDYVLKPSSYDAMWAIETGKGNCQNYSHVAAALMRASGIPVRIINGVTLREPYHVKMRGGTLTMRMAQGRHSWIEVYFPDLGWIPFDPQQMQLFVSNRFIRVEVGLDNEETVADGTVRWTRFRGTRGRPTYREEINVSFVSDDVNLTAERQRYGPRKMLFTPAVESFFMEVPLEHAEAPAVIPSQELGKLTYDQSFIFGNLEFPEGEDFLDTRSEAEEADDTTMVMHKNFIVETSEYVTTQGQKYAQTFILENPIQVEKVGVALHKFGGSGQLWIELFGDDGSGRPAEIMNTSELLPLSQVSSAPGYHWVDFDFKKGMRILSPGRYWIALAYTGSPIINWFFTYGKPVGPTDGTRYNTMFDETWSHALTYEFNYRIIGMTGSE